MGKKKHICPKVNPMQGVHRFGKDSTNWKGGRILINGYIWIHSPEHPYRNSSNYVAEHRLIIENKIGRLLYPWEVVHHVNEIRDDNHVENLQLLKNLGEHNKIHRIKENKN